MGIESSKNKEKKRGLEFLLQENSRKFEELLAKKKRGWINEEEYRTAREKLDVERLEILTKPEN